MMQYLKVWNLAWPIILANISIPLIGATNVAVMGRLPSPLYIGGVSLGVIVLQCIYWTFAFLRKSTTAITAQAYGARNNNEVVLSLCRGLLIAMLLGLLTVVLQYPIKYIGFEILQGSEEVERLAKIYFDIRNIGAFANYGNYVVLGWLYGIQRTKFALFLRVIINVINIPLAIFFVSALHMDVDGVAYSALISNVAIFFFSLLQVFYIAKKLIQDQYGSLTHFLQTNLGELFHKKQITELFHVNSDIFLRTVVLYCAFSWFTAASASQGDILLAINTVLLNLFWFISYSLDGFANAAETLVGQAIGAKNHHDFDKAVLITTQLSIVFALCFTISYLILEPYLIGMLTNIPSIQAASHEYFIWLALLPITGIWCFQFDGIYTGATQTKTLRNMMAICFVVYAIAIIYLPRIYANHGLWLSLHIFMIARGISLYLPYRKIRASLFQELHDIKR